MHTHVWKIMELLKTQKHAVEYFAINSNLVSKPALFDKLMLESKDVKGFHLYTSNESCGAQSEYIRDGMDWDLWKNNLQATIDSNNFDGINVMCTISALALEGLVDFLKECVAFKKMNSRKFPQFSLNILRFPNFQSPLILPLEMRLKFSENLAKFLDENQDYLNEMEMSQGRRLCVYLKQKHETNKDLEQNFKNYFKQYDKRRNKDFEETFPIIGDWYRGI